MGIPRLRGLLESYFQTSTLGCSDPGCRDHIRSSKPVIIDGPGLVYVIYYRLLACKPTSLNAIDAQPTYEEIGTAVLLFLQTLTNCGSEIDKIYFDGYLPTAKRPVRKNRLQGYLKQTIVFHTNYKDFKRPAHRDYSIATTPTDLFDVSRPIPPKFRGLPAVPFLVPAVLDSLTNSKYAAVTQVVPGEADSFCAAAARASGGIVLTSDSDLLIHDLGPDGEVIFFDHLELQQCGRKHSQICARIAEPFKIAQSLDLKDLFRFAFELKEDPSLTLQEVQRRTQTDIPSHRASDYTDFEKEYEQLTVDDAAQSTSSADWLDPRISEMILQYHGRPQENVHMYMPFLIEDPSRSSAWNISIDLRTLAYSLMAHCTSIPKQQQNILEHSRRDTRIVPMEIQLLDFESSLENAESLNRQLDALRRRHCSSPAVVIWRIFGMTEVFSWHLTTGRTFPIQRSAAKAIWGNKDTFISWQDVQLSAQLQAALYSVRLLKQVLVYVISHYDLGSDAIILELLRNLKTLPALSDLFRGYDSTTAIISGTEIGPIFDFIRNSVWKQENSEFDNHEGADVSISTGNKSHDDSVDETTAWVTVGSKHKKLKRQFKKSADEGPISKGPLKQTNNIYGLLSDT